MNIILSEYSIHTNSIDIYVSGCNGPHCIDCHNPETWNFNQGIEFKKYYEKFLINKINQISTIFDKFMIFGGEPLDQDISQLLELLELLKIHRKEIWLFTRYELSQVPLDVLCMLDYIKTGRYIKNSQTHIEYGIELASINQHIHKLK